MDKDPNPRVLYAENHTSLKRKLYLHGHVVFEGLTRYNIGPNIVIPRYLAEHIHKRLGEILARERID
jgi:hypothetical protein